MNQIKVKIPWWYKPFIKFMPDFYEDFIEYKEGKYRAEAYMVRYSFFGSSAYWVSEKDGYKNTQKAYLKARWMALWKDFWTVGSDHGVYWEVTSKKHEET